MTLSIGDQAPDFTLPASGDRTLSLADFKGKKLVLFFYPKASTPGCTTESIDFTNLKDAFAAKNCAVVGASKDSVKRQDNFTAKNDLGVPLLSDEEGTLVESYGVWVEKMNYGRTYMGIERSTFLIDEEGRIENIWRKVRVKGHAEAVLQSLK